MRMIKQILAILFTFAAMVSCKAETPNDLSPKEFNNRISVDSTAVVLDVRTPQEFGEGHLAKAVNLDYTNQSVFVPAIEQLDRSKTYYVYCRSGRRSAAACSQMQKIGLTVYNLSGGIQGWKGCGYSVVK